MFPFYFRDATLRPCMKQVGELRRNNPENYGKNGIGADGGAGSSAQRFANAEGHIYEIGYSPTEVHRAADDGVPARDSGSCRWLFDLRHRMACHAHPCL